MTHLQESGRFLRNRCKLQILNYVPNYVWLCPESENGKVRPINLESNSNNIPPKIIPNQNLSQILK